MTEDTLTIDDRIALVDWQHAENKDRDWRWLRGFLMRTCSITKNRAGKMTMAELNALMVDVSEVVTTEVADPPNGDASSPGEVAGDEADQPSPTS